MYIKSTKSGDDFFCSFDACSIHAYIYKENSLSCVERSLHQRLKFRQPLMSLSTCYNGYIVNCNNIYKPFISDENVKKGKKKVGKLYKMNSTS